MVVFKEIPPGLKKLLKPYNKELTESQSRHFETYVTGLIVCSNKTVQEINDSLSDTNQSSLNRFLTESDWGTKQIEGIFICDPSFIHKTGKHMQNASYQRSGVTKKKEWGYSYIDSLYVENDIVFPVTMDFYVPKTKADKYYPFRTHRQIFLEQLYYSIKQKLPVSIVMVDAGLYADFVLNEIKSLKKKYKHRRKKED